MTSLHTLDFDKPIPHGILNDQNNDAFSTCFAAVLDDQGLIEQINQMFDLKIKINEPKTQIEKLIDIAAGYAGFNFTEKEWKAPNFLCLFRCLSTFRKPTFDLIT